MSEGNKFEFNEKENKPKKKTNILTGLLAGTAILLAVGYTWYTMSGNKIGGTFGTSTSQEFQQEQTGLGRIQIPKSNGITQQQPSFDLSGIDEAAKKQAVENARLQAEIARLQNDQAGGSATNAELKKQISDLTKLVSEQQIQSAAASKAMADEMAAALQAEQTARDLENEKLRLAMLEQQNANNDAALQSQLEQQKLAERKAARAKAYELHEAQIKSVSVVYDDGQNQSSNQNGSNSNAQVTLGADGQPLPPTVDERGRAFVEDRSRPVDTIQSEVIANPSITVPQGSLIIASLETAINSQLPGEIIAVVNHPVESMDAKNVLIPEGSKLFGEYQTAQDIGERRIQVAWTRLVTPDGRSVRMNTYGADQLGRSGVTGRVNNRLGAKFAAAALVSIVSAGPILASNNSSNGSSDNSNDAVTNLSTTLANTLTEAVKPYLDLKPIINIKQGALVTVIVNQDIEVTR